MAERLWRMTQAHACDGNTCRVFIWGNLRGFESHSFQHFLFGFLTVPKSVD